MMKGQFGKRIHVVEKDGYGHVIFVMKNFIIEKFDSDTQQKLIDRVTLELNNALGISKKYHKGTVYVHVYLDGFSMSNFSLQFFRRVSRHLESVFKDTLEQCIIYSSSDFFPLVLSLMGTFVNSETSKKIKHVRNKD